MSPCSVSGPRRHPVSLDPRHLSDPGTRAAEQVVPAEHAGSKSRILRAEEKTCFYGGRFHWFRLKYFVLACTHTHTHTPALELRWVYLHLSAWENSGWHADFDLNQSGLCIGKPLSFMVLKRQILWWSIDMWRQSFLHIFWQKFWNANALHFLGLIMMLLMCNMRWVVQNTTFESRVCLCVNMCEIKTWKSLICALRVRPRTCREGGRESISLCTVQLSKSLFDFVKCKSRRSATAANYRYEIRRGAKTNCFCNHF